jgi:hypothetical protein
LCCEMKTSVECRLEQSGDRPTLTHTIYAGAESV